MPSPLDPCRLSRRRLLLLAAGTGLASGIRGAAPLFAAGPGSLVEQGPAPGIRTAFLRPREKYWLGWPGASFDVDGTIRRFQERIERFGKELNVRVAPPATLYDDEGVNAFITSVEREQPEGVVVIPLHMNRWAQVNRIARCKAPTIVFAPLGTAFTGHLQAVRGIKGVYLASSGDYELGPVRFGLKMIRAAHEIRHTRIAVVRGTDRGESTYPVLGLTLRYVPRDRFAELFHATPDTAEMERIADEILSGAKQVVEPTRRDVVNGVKNWFVARRIMEEEGCRGITMDCLGLVAARKIPCPPCLAWARFLDTGVPAVCEADLNAVLSHTVTCRLLDRPGFQQDPVPDTVKNTLIGAHCVCATRLDGFDAPPQPYILRSHSESNLGVSYQVKWPVGRTVTVMQMSGPDKMLLGKGVVRANHDTPPAGGCRTSVELAMDGPEDVADTKGFHQLFIFDDHVRAFKAFAHLFGIQVEHV